MWFYVYFVFNLCLYYAVCLSFCVWHNRFINKKTSVSDPCTWLNLLFLVYFFPIYSHLLSVSKGMLTASMLFSVPFSLSYSSLFTTTFHTDLFPLHSSPQQPLFIPTTPLYIALTKTHSSQYLITSCSFRFHNR